MTIAGRTELGQGDHSGVAEIPRWDSLSGSAPIRGLAGEEPGSRENSRIKEAEHIMVTTERGKGEAEEGSNVTP